MTVGERIPQHKIVELFDKNKNIKHMYNLSVWQDPIAKSW